MRAARFHRYGPAEVLVVEEVPSPALGAGQVRVAVVAASVNPVDCKARSGSQRAIMRWTLPWVTGLDLAGVVVECGPGATDFAVGDRVWGSPSHRRWGTCAEECVVDQAELGLMPESLDFVEAASIPLAGITAWQCVVPFLRENEGARCLIQAGSGGVGTLAIQLAHAEGAHVITTCSARNTELVRSLGAHEVLDYRAVQWWRHVAELDLVLDCLGPVERNRALGCVRRGGRVAAITSGLPDAAARWGPSLGAIYTGLGMAGFWMRGRVRGVDAANVVRTPSRAILDDLAARVHAGVLKPVIHKVFELADIVQAHREVETGRARGKVCVQVHANPPMVE